MLKQSSAGVVIYRKSEDRSRVYLLLQYPGKYWDFPKGKLENGERWIDAAYREAKEETGIDVVINENFEYSYTYYFSDFKGNRVEKTVVFFIGLVCTEISVTLSYEHIDYLWLSYDQARMQVHFESARKMLDEVELFLCSEEKKLILTMEGERVVHA